MSEDTPTPPAPLTADELAALFGPLPGHVETPGPGPVVFAHIHLDARDLLDTIMEAWEAAPPPANPNGAPASIYQFAYWLLRYSGLINAPLQAAAPAIRATLTQQAAEIARLRAALADTMALIEMGSYATAIDCLATGLRDADPPTAAAPTLECLQCKQQIALRPGRIVCAVCGQAYSVDPRTGHVAIVI